MNCQKMAPMTNPKIPSIPDVCTQNQSFADMKSLYLAQKYNIWSNANLPIQKLINLLKQL